MDKINLPIESIDEACIWMARLWADNATKQDYKDCEVWRNADPSNEAAWQQIQKIRSRFDSMPDRKAGSRLLARGQGVTRRQLLGYAGLSVGVGLIGVDKITPDTIELADYTTVTGEIHVYILVDGTRLILNTSTRVDVEISETERKIHLLKGEIWVATGSHHLPLTIVGRDAQMQPLGTEFTIRQLDNQTRLCVYQGRVQIIPANKLTAKRIIENGEGADFNAKTIRQIFTTQIDATAWIQGKLAVADMPLTIFIAELSRYRPGILRVSAELSKQTVTGVFSLNDTEKVLTQLSAILPVKIRRITPWWVTLLPI